MCLVAWQVADRIGNCGGGVSGTKRWPNTGTKQRHLSTGSRHARSCRSHPSPFSIMSDLLLETVSMICLMDAVKILDRPKY